MKGQCMCGAVTITAESEQNSLAACHCDMCRRWGGVFIALPTQAGSVAAEGPIKVYQSSDWAERAFCEVCGSNLWYRITAEGLAHGVHQLSAGLFDVNGMHLSLEVFIDGKPDAYAFEGERKQMTGQEVMSLYAPKARDA